MRSCLSVRRAGGAGAGCGAAGGAGGGCGDAAREQGQDDVVDDVPGEGVVEGAPVIIWRKIWASITSWAKWASVAAARAGRSPRATARPMICSDTESSLKRDRRLPASSRSARIAWTRPLIMAMNSGVRWRPWAFSLRKVTYVYGTVPYT